MPIVFTEEGFRFVIYFNDHPPAHCHVYKGSSKAQIYLNPVGVRENRGFNPRETQRILSIARRRRAELLAV